MYVITVKKRQQQQQQRRIEWHDFNHFLTKIGKQIYILVPRARLFQMKISDIEN